MYPVVTTLALLGVLTAFAAGIWVGCGVTIKSARRVLDAERAWKDVLQSQLAIAMRQLPPALGQQIIAELEKAKANG